MKILVLGAGFGGLNTVKYLLKFLKHTRKSAFQIILVDENDYFTFKPLIHEVVINRISAATTILPLKNIFLSSNFKFIQGKVKKINLKDKVVEIITLENYHKLSYDYLVIALGSKTAYYNIPGAQKYSFSLNTIDDALILKNHLFKVLNITNSKNLKDESFLNCVVIGGGATGIELAACLRDFFSRKQNNSFQIFLIEKNNELLPQFSFSLRQKALDRLIKLKVNVILGKGVTEIGQNFVKLDDQTFIKSQTIIWVAGVEPNLPEIIPQLEKDNKGRLIVNKYLQIENFPNVFVLGDVACFLQNQHPLPQLAQVAVKEAKRVALNIFNYIEKRPLNEFIYHHSGDLISLDNFYALGEIKKFPVSGFLAWILWRGVYFHQLPSLKNKLSFLKDIFYNFIYEYL